jgi:hypothetical protein
MIEEDSIDVLVGTSLSESRYTKGRQIGADRISSDLLGAAFDLCLGTRCTGARRAGRADSCRRALDFWATRARAWRTLAAFGFDISTCVNDNGLLFRKAGFQDVVGEVRDGWALRLQHIIGEVGACWARRDTRLQHVFGHVWHRRAHRRVCLMVRAGIGASTFRAGGIMFRGRRGFHLVGIIVLESFTATSPEY